MKIGLLNDLHIGHHGVGRWHNRMLFDEAETIARQAVAALNRQHLDLVMVLGDVTQHGTVPQFEQARAVLSGLRCPWMVVPGNHDYYPGTLEHFDAVFTRHLPPLYRMRDTVGLLTLRQLGLPEVDPDVTYSLGEMQIARATAAVAAQRPRQLLVFSHAPLLPEEEFAAAHDGKYAGHFGDGLALLTRLHALGMRPLCFCAHQHWHHVVRTPRWTQCVTAAMIEWPMQPRVVWCDDAGVRTTVLPSVDTALAEQSLIGLRWVGGDETDRECALG